MIGSYKVFFLLVFALSAPFYFLGALGGRMPGMPMLPASAFMTFMPMLAALILVWRQRGYVGVWSLLKSGVSFNKVRGMGWHVVAILFIPAVCLLELAILRASGIQVPIPKIEPTQGLLFFVEFFIAAIGEELGWQGYAYPALRKRYSALASALILGVVWALWHVIPFAQMGRSGSWIIWHSLCAVAMRVIMVSLFERAGNSVLNSVLFHMMINVSWALFPIARSLYDPFVTFMILMPAATIVVLSWRRTLATA